MACLEFIAIPRNFSDWTFGRKARKRHTAASPLIFNTLSQHFFGPIDRPLLAAALRMRPLAVPVKRWLVRIRRILSAFSWSRVAARIDVRTKNRLVSRLELRYVWRRRAGERRP